MADSYQNGEYATSSHNTKALRTEKDALRAQGYPPEAVERLVDSYLHLERFKHLAGKDNVFLPAPSTSRTNIVPLVLCERLQTAYGGEIVLDWARTLNKVKAANKGGIAKLRDPVRVEPGSEFGRLVSSRNFILVDDVVTTGQTTDALRDLLRTRGIEVAGILSLGQSELRLASARDLERITQKLGEPLLAREVQAVFAGKLKHYANYIEREIRPGTREEVRTHLVDSARRIEAAHAVQLRAVRSVPVGGEVAARLQPGPNARAGLPERDPVAPERLPRGPDERLPQPQEEGAGGSVKPLPEQTQEQLGRPPVVVRFANRDCTLIAGPPRGQAPPTFRLLDAATGEPVATITTDAAHRPPAAGCVHVKNHGENAGLAAALARSGAFEHRRDLLAGMVVEMRVADPSLQSHVERHAQAQANTKAAKPTKALRPGGLTPER